MPPKFGGAPKCPVCASSVYAAEKTVSGGKAYHRACFRCQTCDKALEPGKGLDHDGHVFCLQCHSAVGGTAGLRAGSNVSTAGAKGEGVKTGGLVGKAKIEALEKELAEQRTAAEEAEKAAEEARAHAAKQAAELGSALEATEAEKAAAEERAAKALEQVEAARAAAEEAKSEARNTANAAAGTEQLIRDELKASKEQSETLRKQLSEERANLEKERARVAAARADAESARRDLAAATSGEDDVKASLEASRKQLEAAREATDAVKTQVESLRAQLATERDARRRLESELDDAKREAEEMGQSAEAARQVGAKTADETKKELLRVQKLLGAAEQIAGEARREADEANARAAAAAAATDAAQNDLATYKALAAQEAEKRRELESSAASTPAGPDPATLERMLKAEADVARSALQLEQLRSEVERLKGQLAAEQEATAAAVAAVPRPRRAVPVPVGEATLRSSSAKAASLLADLDNFASEFS